jgi:hypothetical protein
VGVQVGRPHAGRSLVALVQYGKHPCGSCTHRGRTRTRRSCSRPLRTCPNSTPRLPRSCTCACIAKDRTAAKPRVDNWMVSPGCAAKYPMPPPVMQMERTQLLAPPAGATVVGVAPEVVERFGVGGAVASAQAARRADVQDANGIRVLQPIDPQHHLQQQRRQNRAAGSSPARHQGRRAMRCATRCWVEGHQSNPAHHSPLLRHHGGHRVQHV